MDVDFTFPSEANTPVWGTVTGTLSDQTDLDTKLDTIETAVALNTAKVTSIADIQTRTASFSTSTGNQYNKCNSATAINATLNSGIPIGSTLAFSQANVGEVTFVAGTSVTIEPTGKKLVEGSATAICIATDTYRLDGNLEDV